MEDSKERRREKRLRYHWPVWFAEDFNESLSQGQMVDVSSAGAAFTCRTDEHYPCVGQHLTARFSVPRFQPGDAFDMANFVRSGRICRVEDINQFSRCIAVQFAEPLPFKPGEQADGESDVQQEFRAVAV